MWDIYFSKLNRIHLLLAKNIFKLRITSKNGDHSTLKNKYLIQFLVLCVWVAVTILLFLIIQNRQVVAVIAGLGFLLIPANMLFSEWQGLKNKFHLATLSFFLLTASPILVLRLIHWGEDFNELSFLGLPTASLHYFSKYTYMAMMASSLYMFWKTRK